MIFLNLLVLATSATMSRAETVRPQVPILNRNNVELQKDMRYVKSVDQILVLEKLHLPIMPVLANPESYYLLHQSDYCILYNKLENRPEAVFATLKGPIHPLETKRFAFKRMDPRTHTWNTGESPLFRPELSSSRSNAIETWISTNMVTLPGRGYENFMTFVIPQLIGNKSVNIIIEPIYGSKKTNVIALQFYISYLDLKQNTAFEISVKDLNDNEVQTNSQEWFEKHHRVIRSNEMHGFTLKISPTRFWTKTAVKPNVRTPTDEPQEFLCKNDGQYSPWWSDELWDRCGKAVDEDNLEVTAICHCDDSCLTRKDCCTDYLQSCKSEPVWKTRECYTESEFTCPSEFDEEPATIIISFDGFRRHYFERNMTPNIMKLRECGSTAKHMQPSYPSKTFPNHYALVTGLHPSQHGIVDNDWFDWKRQADCSVFTPNTEQYPCNVSSNDEHWWGGDPFWNTVERHDKISGTLLWPGCDLLINGEQATYHWDYADKGHGPFGERVYGLLDWMNLPKWDGKPETKEKSRPNFMTFYLDEPDHTGHAFGPYDTTGEIDKALVQVDTVIGMILDGLKMYGLDKCINIILTSDHGMEEGTCENTVALANIANDELDDVFINAKSTTGVIGAKREETWGSNFNIQRALDKFQCTHDENNLRAFDKYLFPKRLHYGSTTQIDTILLLMDRYNKTTLKPKEPCKDEGYMATHGWDNKYEGMQIPLTLWGPKFHLGVELPVLQNIEIYKLLMELVGIPSDSPNLNATVMDQQFSAYGKFENVLKNPVNLPEETDFENIKLPQASDAYKTDNWEGCSAITPINDLYLPIYMDMTENSNCLNTAFALVKDDKPFWWESMQDIIFPKLHSKSVRIQAGAVFDVTGSGVYKDAQTWTDGWIGMDGLDGWKADTSWCYTNDAENGKKIFMPSHLYIILSKCDDTETFAAIIPWRLDLMGNVRDYSPCIVCNEEECRQTYPADFNCGMQSAKDESEWTAWWIQQMDLHSAKVIEIEKISGIQFFGNSSVQSSNSSANRMSALDSVNLRTTLSSFGDFEAWLNDDSSCAPQSSTTTKPTTATTAATTSGASEFPFSLICIIFLIQSIL